MQGILEIPCIGFPPLLRRDRCPRAARAAAAPRIRAARQHKAGRVIVPVDDRDMRRLPAHPAGEVGLRVIHVRSADRGRNGSVELSSLVASIESLKRIRLLFKCLSDELFEPPRSGHGMILSFVLPIFRLITTSGTRAEYAIVLGDLSTLCFFLDSVPQFFFNLQRRSVHGFSLTSVLFEVVGSSFLWINSVYREAPLSVVLYGFVNTVQNFGFLVQFYVYAKRAKPLFFLACPIVPIVICEHFHSFMKYTDLVKPLTQLVSNIPQLVACMRVGTTTGLSFIGQHLHLAGSIVGFMTLILDQNFSGRTWLLYVSSFAQTYSIYALAAWFGELRISETGGPRTDGVAAEYVESEDPWATGMLD
jgi:hypothetical protein